MRLLEALTAIGPLLGPSDKPISDLSTRFAGKRVGLYFSAGWCPMCTGFEPALHAFREECEAGGTPVELVYVSSDRSAADAAQRAQSLQCATVPYEHVDGLKLIHKVWSGSEQGKLGTGRRSGVPAIVVINPENEEIAFIDAEARGSASLKRWDLGAGVF